MRRDGRAVKTLSREEFMERPEALKGFVDVTPEELNEFNPHLDRLFGGLEFEERDGNIAIHEPEERYSADGEEPGRKYTTGADGRERAVTSRDSEDGDKTMLRDGEDMTDGERLLAIRALEPIEVKRNELSKAELFEEYRGLLDIYKDEDTIQFLRTAFGKTTRREVCLPK